MCPAKASGAFSLLSSAFSFLKESAMRRFRLVAVLLLASTTSCVEITAANTAELVVGLKAKTTGSSCVFASPDPVSIRVNQGLGFQNNGSGQLTVILEDDDTPLVSVGPSQKSGGIKFSDPGTYRYYIQGCGGSSAELHTINVTVN
jgi:hypothetical protein